MGSKFLFKPAGFILILFLLTQCSKTIDNSSRSAIDIANTKSVGASANEILSADKPSLLLEINYMPGFQLDRTSLQSLHDFLSTYTRKSAFQIIEKQIAASGKDSLSISDIDKIERANRTAFNTSNQVAVYLLVTDGTSNPANTLGYAYRNTSIAIFGRAMKTLSGGVSQVPRWKLETTTLEHEFGHLFGLVDIGSPMQVNHKDPANPQHCSNRNCLMYYQTETAQMLGSLISGGIPVIDVNCHNDLIANGGK